MPALEDDPVAWRTSARRREALRLALRLYGAQIRRSARFSIPALLVPALGNIAIFYVPPLVVARLAGRLSDGPLSTSQLTPYLLAVAASLVTGEVLWRVAVHFLNRADGYGIEHLYTPPGWMRCWRRTRRSSTTASPDR